MALYIALVVFGTFMFWSYELWLSNSESAEEGNDSNSSEIKFGYLPGGDVSADGESWIYIQSGTVPDVAEALKSYSELGNKDTTIRVSAEIYESDSGIKVKLSKETPAYYFANIIGWLSCPPEGRSKSCMGWYRSPDGSRYFLIPEPSGGDRLLGVSSSGVFINYSLPLGMITKSDKVVSPAKEPGDIFSHRTTLTLELEDLGEWGNTSFSIDE